MLAPFIFGLCVVFVEQACHAVAVFLVQATPIHTHTRTLPWQVLRSIGNLLHALEHCHDILYL